jgi:2,4-dienoyl-CoA reductase-like NADH-dependent reductase (Old Yellow Enzyme family)
MHTTQAGDPAAHPRTLWEPVTVGTMRLPQRLAMSPMTRSRANADGTPGALAAEYYAQRASMGLLITEGTQPSDDGQGYLCSPGIYTDAQVAGWRRVIAAVRTRGGHVVVQLMHAGRMAHPDNTPHHRQPVAPSALAPGVDMFTAHGMLPAPVPRALDAAGIQATVDDFAHAAECAMAAGAEAVEVHGANGYLVQQFLSPNSNRRTDGYGGSIEHRMRFALEVVAAIAARVGPEHAAIRLSPGGHEGGIEEGPEGPALYRRLVPELAKYPLAYLHLIQRDDEALLHDLRRAWPGSLLVNRVDRPLAELARDVEANLADVAVVGKWALANPDFVARIRRGAPLNPPDHATFFGGGARGYVDYPTLAAGAAARG